MISLLNLIKETVPDQDVSEMSSEELEVAPNSHETVTVGNQSFFVTNLRRDGINVELKMVNGVAFVTIK